MSYSFNIPVTLVADFEAAAVAAKATYVAQLAVNDMQIDATSDAQADALIKAASDLVSSGLFGDTAYLTAGVSGHTNPDHGAGETAYISFSVCAAPVAAK